MNKIFAVLSLAAVAVTAIPAPSAHAGCLGGAAIGAIGGHFVGRGHALAGAAAGCAVGHHSAKVQERNRVQQNQARSPYDAQAR